MNKLVPAGARAVSTPAPTLSARVGVLQRKCACGAGGAGLTGECEECSKKRLTGAQGGGALQRALATSAVRAQHDEPTEVPRIVHDVLRSPGQPLDEATRAFFEPRFGHDFSRVRVHTDAAAAESARAVNARAYTAGRDIAFASGQYARSAKGDSLLAHELAHVVQQGGRDVAPDTLRLGPRDDVWERGADDATRRVTAFHAPAVRSLGGPQMSAPAGVVRRAPGENARESWGAMVTPVLPENAEKKRRAEEAIRRLQLIPSGAQLLNNLWTRFCARSPRCRSQIGVRFVDALPRRHGGDASGFFEPDSPDQPRYDVWVKNATPLPTGGGAISLGGAWPGGSPVDIPFSHVDAESDMAETMYHELLHVWFLHAHPGAPYPTGHGDVMRGEIDPVFLNRIRVFMGELDALEKRVKAEAAAREREAATTPAPTPRAEPPTTSPAPASRSSTGPSLFGGEVSIHGGAGGIRGAAAGTGIIGADLVLNRIYSLRLGARGVYLTPDRLLAGGTVGLRILEEGKPASGPPIENPLFFDVEAGVLAEISPAERDRITRNIAVLGSAGVGQEFGREGPRFFWRVGGFVVVSDTGEVAGGGTAGAGVRF